MANTLTPAQNDAGEGGWEEAMLFDLTVRFMRNKIKIGLLSLMIYAALC